ncbi:MAG: glycoside hydrolase family 31 protein [Fulvivirga sp.]
MQIKRNSDLIVMIDTPISTRNKSNNSLGNLKEYRTSEGLLECVLDNAFVRISVYSASVIKTHISFDGYWDHNPYSVIQNPSSNELDLKDENGCITLSTANVILEINKAPFRLTFKTVEGKVINADDEAFGTASIGEQITAYKKLQADERFVGLGEKTGPLDRRGSGYQNWNTDHFGYGPESDPLYCSTPFYIGLHSGLSYGIYLDNSHKSHFNFGASNDRFSSFSVDSGDMCYYFIYNNDVAGILNSYAELTGYMPLPPIWSIGYQQCRYSYYPDKQVSRLAETFRDKDIPADVIVLDIHYMEKYKIFTWDGEKFPDPKALINHLKSLGFHVVVMCDPGIKIEDGYEAYQSGMENDVFVKYPDGSNYSGSVWPGLCHFPDFTNEKTRNWWGEQMKSYTDLGVDGFWNDMNEIATWGQMLPELIEFKFEGDKATSRKGRNIYGFQMSRATYEGTKHNLNGLRPFNLTRAGFSGIQRYAAVWTGDNVANDEHMLLGVRLVNSMGLAGIAFAGYDVGGFVGNANEALFARWVQIGAFSPFFRGHSMINSRDSEPWSYGEQVEEISKNYISLRYKLMPYLYSSFYEATHSGLPVARSLAIDYSFDDKIYSEEYQNQYLFGQSILVAPVESNKHLTKVYLPEGDWYDLLTDARYKGNTEIVAECGIEHLPVFVKASAIIPITPQAKTNTQNLGDVLELHVYKGSENNSFVYYEDDGESFAHEAGSFYKRTITYQADEKQLIVSDVEGAYDSKIKHLHICFHGFEDVNDFKINNSIAIAEHHSYRFINPISNFDPIDSEVCDGLKIEQLATVKTKNLGSEIVISW